MTTKINFTKRVIEELVCPSGANRIYCSDTKVPHLIVDVTAGGAKSFYIYRKVNGSPARIYLGKFPEVSIDQIRNKGYEINAAIGRGEDPRQKTRRDRDELTLDQLFEVYIERHGRQKKTTEIMKKDFQRNASMLKRRRLSEITSLKAYDLFKELTTKQGPYSANRTVQLLRAVYNKGRKWRLFDGDNPFSEITLNKERSRDRFLSEDEIARLISVLKCEKKNPVTDFVILSLCTGARKSNLLAMKWEEIDWEQCLWCIPDTKNGTPQQIKLGESELSILRARFEINDKRVPPSDFVFPGRGRTAHLADPKKGWIRLCQLAGLDDCTIHDIRRSVAAGLASANVNLALVKGIMNHKDMKTTIAVYARTHLDAEQKARESIQRTWWERSERFDNGIEKREVN